MAICKDGVAWGATMVHKMADRYEEMKKVGKPTKQGLRQMYVELYVNQLLSGGKTMIVNPLSSLMKAGQMMGERYSAAAVNSVMGRKGADWQAANLFAAELVTGLRDASKVFWDTLKSGKPSFQGQKIEEFGVSRAMTADNLQTTALDWAIRGDRSRATANAIGAIVNVPGRILMAQDDFAKALVQGAEKKYRASIMSREYATGVLKTTGGDRWEMLANKKYNELLNDPKSDSKLLQAMEDAGKETTFTGDFPEKSLMKRVSDATQEYTVLRIIQPFTKVPSNITSAVMQSFPLISPLLSKTLRAQLKSADPIVRQIAHGKLLLSNTIAAGSVALSLDGTIGGPGPLDAKLKADRRRMGHWPNAINLDLDGDGIKEWHGDYSRFQPFAAIINNAVAFAEFAPLLAEWEIAEYATNLTLTILNNITDHPMMASFSQIGDVLDAARKGDTDTLIRLGVEKITTATPIIGATALNDARRTVDNQKRLTDGDSFLDSLLQSYKNRMPWVSQGLAPDYDIWGRKIEYGVGLSGEYFDNWLSSLVDAIVPFRQKSDNPDEAFVVNQLMVNEVSFPGPSKREFGFEFTPIEQSEFSRMLGQGIVGEDPDDPLVKPLLADLLDLITDTDGVKKGERVNVRSSWINAPAGQYAGKGNKQDRVSDLRAKRKKKIGLYMATLEDADGKPVFPGLQDKMDKWRMRREGEMRAPRDVKQDQSVPPPIF